MDEPPAAGAVVGFDQPALPGLDPGPGLWPPTVKRLSASAISTFLTCPEQFRRRYVHRERYAVGAPAVIGSVDHAVHEHNLRQKITSRRDLPLRDLLEVYDDAWKKKLDEEGGESSVDWRDFTPAKAKDTGSRIIEPYHLNVSPLLQPTTVEDWFRIELPGIPVPVVGRIDVEAAVYDNERREGEPVLPHVIIDRKVVMKAPPKKLDGGNRLQGLVYMLARSTHAHFHYIDTQGRMAIPPLVPLVVPFNRGGLAAAYSLIGGAVNQIAAAWSEYGPDDPWPGDGLVHAWACGYCSARPTCVYWSGGGGPK